MCQVADPAPIPNPWRGLGLRNNLILLRNKIYALHDVCVVLICLLFVLSQLQLRESWKVQERMASQAARVSPLEEMLEKIEAVALSDEEQGLLEEIKRVADFEQRSVVIAETVVPVGSEAKLMSFVEEQLAASRDVVDRAQVCAVLEMLKLVPKESALLKEEVGTQGTMSTSVALVLFKQHADNLHFMLLATKAEPHLRLNFVSMATRNEWRRVISKYIMQSVIADAKKKFVRVKMLQMAMETHDNTFLHQTISPDAGAEAELT